MHFIYGSTVYGTTTPQSDTDVAVVNTGKNTVIHEPSTYFPSLTHFIHNVRGCDPIALECYSMQFHDDYVDWYDSPFEIRVPCLNTSTLRRVYSQKASNSFVKAKKKLIVENDYDKYASMKSLFHSIRLLNFAEQIAQHGYVVNFQAENDTFSDIQELYDKSSDEVILSEIASKFKKIYNSRATAFRLVAPKVGEYSA